MWQVVIGDSLVLKIIGIVRYVRSTKWRIVFEGAAETFPVATINYALVKNISKYSKYSKKIL